MIIYGFRTGGTVDCDWKLVDTLLMTSVYLSVHSFETFPVAQSSSAPFAVFTVLRMHITLLLLYEDTVTVG